MLEATFAFDPQLPPEGHDAPPATGGTALDELEARQDEVLAQLEALNERILAALREFGGAIAAEAEVLTGQGTRRDERRSAA